MDDADVILPVNSFSDYSPIEANGDFNGDGFDDIAVAQSFPAGPQIRLIFGKADFSLGTYDPGNDLVVLVSMAEGGFFSTLTMGDMNGDGKSELIIGLPLQNVARGRLVVVAGRSVNPGTIDLRQGAADLTVLGKNASALGTGLAVGDFDGDGLSDVLAIAQNAQEAYIVPGTSSFSGAVIDLMGAGSLKTFRFPLTSFPGPAFAGDVNGDGKDDVILPDAPPNSLKATSKIHLVWGNAGLPSLWNFNVTPANLTVQGDGSGEGVACLGTGDFDGDGRRDLLVQQQMASRIFPGSLLSSGISAVSPSTGSAFYSPGISVPSLQPNAVTGDFDGDGRSDIFSGTSLSPGILLNSHLTRDAPLGWPLGGSFESSLQLRVGAAYQFYLRSALGDVNGDGRKDFLLASDTTDKIYIVFGHVSLRDPHISVETPGQQARVGVSLSVNGEPREMKLGGDIVDSFRDQWIPFKTHQAITLTHALEEKTITAVFRNSLKRESDAAEAKVSLTTGRAGVDLISNRVRPNSRAVIECSLETAGHLRVTLWASDGDRVTVLVDEDRGPGIWTLEWDGRNRDGKRVAPGVYILQTEMDGRVERKKILVQG